REGAVRFLGDADLDRSDRALGLGIEHHRQHDHGKQDQCNGTDQPSAPPAFQCLDVLLFFSHASTSPTVRKEPNTTILSFSPARPSAAANASAGEAKHSPATNCASSCALAARGPCSDARCQRVTRGASVFSTPPMSLSRSMPQTAMVSGAKPDAARLLASVCAACGLCATSRITCG